MQSAVHAITGFSGLKKKNARCVKVRISGKQKRLSFLTVKLRQEKTISLSAGIVRLFQGISICCDLFCISRFKKNKRDVDFAEFRDFIKRRAF